jgi:cysteinyl-tRNA synthetase
MLIYNTLTRRKEEFTPIHEGRVGFYICGPTVYNYIHIGNARTFLSFDVIRRYLEYLGYQVDFVQNITDVDDKIIRRAEQEGRSVQEVARFYTQAFIDSMHALGVEDPTVRPRATEEIPAMIALIECLIDGHHAYAVDGDVYFAVRSFTAYGRLSGRDVDDLLSGARVEVDERKRDPLDFALWKAAKPDEPAWDSPWGKGRPGWHIECSAMSAKYLGNPFDIHAGGDDLVFPHHENEIAQSEACYHNGFANYWLHGGMLTIDKAKMSKSDGNFMLLKDVLEQVSPQALRLLMLQTHYRSPFDYSPQRLTEATAALERIQSALRNMRWSAAYLPADNIAAASADTAIELAGPLGEDVPADKDVGAADATRLADKGDPTGAVELADTGGEEAALAPEIGGAATDPVQLAKSRFKLSMDDDFNTAAALAAVYELISAGNKLAAAVCKVSDAAKLERTRAAVIELLAVLGVDLDAMNDQWQGDYQAVVTLATKLVGYKGDDLKDALAALLELRRLARSEKNWEQADKVRAGLLALGLAIEDTPQGQRLVVKDASVTAEVAMPTVAGGQAHA